MGSALLLGGILAAVGAPAGAQEPPPPASLGIQDVAKATALTVQVAPSVGALELAVKFGTSVAEIRNRLAQSQSESADLGLVGSALVSEGCDEAAFEESDLPQPLRIDNRAGDASDETAEADPAGGISRVQLQQVRATTQPLAEAITTSSANDFGLVQVSGGRAFANVEVVDGGAARIAHAISEFDVVIPGVLALDGVRWEAFHRTGTEPDARASFTIGAAEVLGQVVPVADVPAADVIAAINPAIAPLGIQLGVPQVERFTEPADLVRIGPLVVRTAPSELRSLILGPLLENSRALRDDLANALIEAECRAKDAVLIAEIILGQVSGIGFTELAIGGAEALTGQVDAGEGLTDPIDALPEVPVDLPPALPGEIAPSPIDTLPRTTSPGPLAQPSTPTAPATRPIGSFEKVCESVHPFRWPKCSQGIGPFVGIGGILAVLGLGAFDWQHQQRLRRKLAGEESGG